MILRLLRILTQPFKQILLVNNGYCKT